MRQICNTIAFYDFTSQDCDLKGWYHYCVAWFTEKGLPPGSIGLPHSTKLLQFKNGHRRLEKSGFEDAKNVSLLGGVSELGTNEGWRVKSFFEPRDDEFYFCFDDVTVSFSQENIFNLTQDLAKFCKFKYGIAYQREFTKGPDFYSVGVIGLEGRVRIPDEEEERIAEWARAYRYNKAKYKTGLLRDVYPFNFLTEPHLTQVVQGKPFTQWIESDPRHGTLQPLTPFQWMWSVPQETLPMIQEILQEAGLLLCYKV